MLAMLAIAATLAFAPPETPRPIVSDLHVGTVHYCYEEWTSTSEATTVEGEFTGWRCDGIGSDGVEYEFAGGLDGDGMRLLGYVLSLDWDSNGAPKQEFATVWNGPTCIAASKIACGSAANVCKLTLILKPDGIMYCSIWCGTPPCAQAPSATNPIYDPEL